MRVATDGPTLLLHFGMTGSLAWEASNDQGVQSASRRPLEPNDA